MELVNQVVSANQPHIRALGIMSGTSMDGIDLALLTADRDQLPKILKLEAHWHVPFLDDERTLIRQALQATHVNANSQKAENFITTATIDAVRQWQRRYPQHQYDIIGWHGQTITHLPAQKFTWQLGNGQTLAQALNTPVIFDFRQNDLRAGGEGAPLAPIFHQALLNAGKLPAPLFAVVNIGGVSNISLVNRHDFLAFDCGPGNGPIDDYCLRVLGKAYDDHGQIAANGQIHQDIVNNLMQHAYFSRPAPKSLDRLDFDDSAVAGLSPADALRTLCAFSAQAIVHGVKQHRSAFPISQMAIAGGGRHNQTLMRELQQCLPDITVDRIETFDHALSGDAIEAWAFAWLAVLRLYDMPASFPTTTGARQPTLAGRLALPSVI